MKRFLPCKRAMSACYVVLATIGYFMNAILSRYISMLPQTILVIISNILWTLILLMSIIFLPHYFLTANTVISKTEISVKGGFFMSREDYMPFRAVKSVSLIQTPLGYFTGFNFVVVNALGSRVLMSFLKRSDARELVDLINTKIRESEVSSDG